MLIHYLSSRAAEQRTASHHFPQHHAERVQIRPDVHADPGKLLRTGELRCPGKASRYRNRSSRPCFSDRLGQAEVDDLCGCSTRVLEVHDDIAWFDIPVNELLL